MPPHGGHGGGHHGGGHGGGGHHGGGHHHHGGGGRRPGGWGPGWYGPGWWGEPGYAELVTVGCPTYYAPVLATDGRVYDNECLAREAGYAVVRRVGPNRLWGAEEDIAGGLTNIALLAGAALVTVLLLRKR